VRDAPIASATPRTDVPRSLAGEITKSEANSLHQGGISGYIDFPGSRCRRAGHDEASESARLPS
jgi:hypothetical protein